MSDRFKFRAWIDEEQIFVTSEDHNEILSDFFAELDKYEVKYERCFEIEQSTGLRDKSGKLIFEGDVVEYPDRDDHKASFIVRTVVKFEAYDCSTSISHLCFCLDQVEIIGNIHENPELLECES